MKLRNSSLKLELKIINKSKVLAKEMIYVGQLDLNLCFNTCALPGQTNYHLSIVTEMIFDNIQ